MDTVCDTPSPGIVTVTVVSRRVQKLDNLDRNVRGAHVERREHGLRHALSVRLGVQKNIRERCRMFFKRYFLHVSPINS